MERLATWLRDQCVAHGATYDYSLALKCLVIRTKAGRVWEFKYLENAVDFACRVWGVSPPREVSL